jgi:hypothetical protein
MKATELRIGNLLRDKVSKTELEVIELTKNDIITKVIDRSKFPLKDGWGIEAIPLTKEWLLKFGFEKEEGWFKKKRLLLFNIRNMYFTTPSKDIVSVDVTGVHQLQNLYFALTNEELTLIK